MSSVETRRTRIAPAFVPPFPIHKSSLSLSLFPMTTNGSSSSSSSLSLQPKSNVFVESAQTKKKTTLLLLLLLLFVESQKRPPPPKLFLSLSLSLFSLFSLFSLSLWSPKLKGNSLPLFLVCIFRVSKP